MHTNSLTRPESEEKIASMFDKIAPKYDLLNKLLSARQDKRWRKIMISKLPKVASKNGRLLDVATGTGDVLLEARRIRGDYNQFEGVDISANMLKLARVKEPKSLVHADSKNSKANFSQMSAENIFFEDNSFNAVTISFGLRNVVRKDRAIGEMFRVLKPGGRLLILEFFEPHNTVLAKAFLFYFHHVLPRIGGLISDKSAYQYLPKSVETFHTSPELVQLLGRTGFSNVQEKCFLFGACRLISGDKK